MSTWTSPADLRAQLMRRWDNGDMLAARVEPAEPAEPAGQFEQTERAEPAGMFPLRLTLSAPSSADLSERFDEVRAWAAALVQSSSEASGAPTYRLLMREVRHRVIGQNSLPAQAWVDTAAAALRMLGKTGEARRFDALCAATRQAQPALLAWLRRQPLRALELADKWPALLSVVAWMQAHPRPDIYLREVDLPGIHSKFLEAQRALFAELFDLTLPAQAINADARGATQFALRYGFRDKPLRVRFRCADRLVLRDSHCQLELGNQAVNAARNAAGSGDFTVSQARFARLRFDRPQVFITENEINFLTFPLTANRLVIFGAGYGFEALASARWLAQCELHYWGDIDTHGFAILDQLRALFPHVQSFLMDRDTLVSHRAQWTPEPQPTTRDLPRLNSQESALYNELRWLKLGEASVRLEQERIAFGMVQRASDKLA